MLYSGRHLTQPVLMLQGKNVHVSKMLKPIEEAEQTGEEILQSMIRHGVSLDKVSWSSAASAYQTCSISPTSYIHGMHVSKMLKMAWWRPAQCSDHSGQAKKFCSLSISSMAETSAWLFGCENLLYNNLLNV